MSLGFPAVLTWLSHLEYSQYYYRTACSMNRMKTNSIESVIVAQHEIVRISERRYTRPITPSYENRCLLDYHRYTHADLPSSISAIGIDRGFYYYVAHRKDNQACVDIIAYTLHTIRATRQYKPVRPRVYLYISRHHSRFY